MVQNSDSEHTGDPYRVKQLTGPGVAGMEDEPYVFHFDLPEDEIEDFILRPLEFFDRIGLDRSKAIPGDRVRIAFSMPVEDGQHPKLQPLKPKICCVATGDGGYECHYWSGPVS